MKIAVAQIAVKKGDITTNLQTHLQFINQASLYQIDLLVFPELSLTGYEPTLANNLAIEQNQLSSNKNIQQLQKLSNEKISQLVSVYPLGKMIKFLLAL